MKNPSGNKLEKLVFGMFDQMVEGSDKYITEQGSTWLIFTEDKRWVVEFTKDKTLWFNYNLFQSELDLVSKDCTQEKDLIKNWFESRFLNTNGVRHAKYLLSEHQPNVEDTIQNSVKETRTFNSPPIKYIEDTIQNGVKETTPSGYLGSIEMKGKVVHQIESPKQNNEVEDTIQNGVKETHERSQHHEFWVKDTIQNGVKHCEDGDWLDGDERFEDIIQNGTK
jgi:hypothetical protein